MNESIKRLARDWVRMNGYDSSYDEGSEFYAKIEELAENGDLAAKQWLVHARCEAGHRELLAAANADRILIPTAVGARTVSIRGSVRSRSADGLIRQREMFEAMTVGQYLAWYRQSWRKHQRDAGELAAHARVVQLVRTSSHDVPVLAALAEIGQTWEDVMQGVEGIA